MVMMVMMVVMMNKIKLIILLLLSVCLVNVFAEDWASEPLINTYFKDEFQTTYWHLGVGAGIGNSYYPNYENNNKYKKYFTILRFCMEKPYYRPSLITKFFVFIEDEEFTDKKIYYGYRDKKQFLLFVGLNYRIPSSLPFITSFIPYGMGGGGYLTVNYQHMFLNNSRMLINSRIEGKGFNAGVSLGCEFEIMENLLSFDICGHWLYGRIKKNMVNDDYNNEDEREIELEDDVVKEWEMNFYFGFIYNLF